MFRQTCPKNQSLAANSLSKSLLELTNIRIKLRHFSPELGITFPSNFGDKNEQAAENLGGSFPFCGSGGSRTLVQTRNPHGFYMLIPLLVFVPCKGTNALNATLSP